MQHIDWLKKTANDDSARGIARKTGLNAKTVSNQINRNSITAENVIAIARAYGAHPVGALVDTGYLDEKDAAGIDPIRALREIDEDDLADEVLRRMKLGQASGALDTPIDELASRRRARAESAGNPTFEEQVAKYGAYAADSSPDEQALRELEEHGGDWTSPENIP